MKYKNITKQELSIPNVGIVAPGETIETEIEINNPNLQEVVIKKHAESQINKDKEN